MFTLNTNAPFELENGELLENLTIQFHTFGTFQSKKNNVIWVCHALTANSDVFDWWPQLFGINGYFNPDEHFIVCANVLGSAYGTTGPLTPLKNRRPLLDHFPFISIKDMVNAHEVLRKHLKIEKIHTIIGASLGGQQVLEWNIQFPELFDHTILIATNARHSAYGIAFNESQRLALYTDPTFGDGTLNGGRAGLIAARSIAMLSYRSYEGYELGQTNPGNYRTNDFLASSYQRYQGQKLADRFNAYSYLTLSKAMDSHNIGRGKNSIEEALSLISAKTLVIGITSDALFPVSEQQFLANNLSNAVFVEIDSKFGHDGFLIETDQLISIFQDFFSQRLKVVKPTVFKLNYN